jgi:hypothetical protein
MEMTSLEEDDDVSVQMWPFWKLRFKFGPCDKSHGIVLRSVQD